jgi:hypothetical protein
MSSQSSLLRSSAHRSIPNRRVNLGIPCRKPCSDHTSTRMKQVYSTTVFSDAKTKLITKSKHWQQINLPPNRNLIFVGSESQICDAAVSSEYLGRVKRQRAATPARDLTSKPPSASHPEQTIVASSDDKGQRTGWQVKLELAAGAKGLEDPGCWRQPQMNRPKFCFNDFGDFAPLILLLWAFLAVVVRRTVVRCL